MKTIGLALAALLLTVCLAACGGEKEAEGAAEEKAEIVVFAAASLQESLDAVIDIYQSETPDVTVTVTYDSSGTLLKQIKEGAPCDLFISAAPKQMNALEEDGLLAEGSRVDLLENQVVLAVAGGNPADIESFDQLAEQVKSGTVRLAVGNGDVPVGQYTLKIFDYYGIDETAIAHKLTYGSNAKEVTTQVYEGTVDCGIVYGTDAFSAGLPVVAAAAAEMCGQVIYPAAVLNCGVQAEAAQAFLDYLSSADAKACFEAVGFAPLT